MTQLPGIDFSAPILDVFGSVTAEAMKVEQDNVAATAGGRGIFFRVPTDGWLSEAAARELTASLVRRYGIQQETTPSDPPPSVPSYVPGDALIVTSDSARSSVDLSPVGLMAGTAVQVMEDRDGDGDYLVKVTGNGTEWYVHDDYLAPAIQLDVPPADKLADTPTAQARTLKIGDVVRFVGRAGYSATTDSYAVVTSVPTEADKWLRVRWLRNHNGQSDGGYYAKDFVKAKAIEALPVGTRCRIIDDQPAWSRLRRGDTVRVIRAGSGPEGLRVIALHDGRGWSVQARHLATISPRGADMVHHAMRDRAEAFALDAGVDPAEFVSRVRLTLARRAARAARPFKACTVCHRDLPARAFAEDVSRSDGLKTRCRMCITQRRAAI